MEALAGIENLVVPTVVTGRRHVFHLFVLQVPGRDKLMAELRANQIGCGLHYPTPIHLHPAYAQLGHGVGAFPHSERVASHGLSLPMFPGMTRDQVEQVAKVIAAHMKEQA
jgi:dTDP-4-amino-4,6-dideoxygalactose transaminase